MSEAKTYTVNRDGKPPLRFTGTIIAETDNRSVRGDRQNRWTEITLYRTKAGKIVVDVTNRTQLEGESDRCRADVVSDAKAVIEWLTADNDGELGSVSQAVLERAAKNDPEFAAAYVEDID
jgi:hypothetical protein